MKKNRAMKKETKIIEVKNGFLKIDPMRYLSGYERFLKVYQDELNKAEKIELAGGEPDFEDARKKIMAAFNKLFGRKACEKVFGKGVSPSWDNFSEFFEKLEALVEKWGDDVNGKV